MEKAEETPATGVEVTMFGEMQFFRAGSDGGAPPVPVRFKTEKTRTFFAYLLLHPGRTFHREVLATQFWPETEDERRNLRDALGFARAALAETGLPDDALATDRNTIRLALGVFRTDVAAFDEALSRADRRPAPPTEEQIAALEEAVALYRGEFLPGLYDVSADDEWIAPTRRRCAKAFDDALLRLSTLYATQNDWRHSLTYARRAADNDPTDESRAARVRELTERVQQAERLLVPAPPSAQSVSSEASVDSAPTPPEALAPSPPRETPAPSPRPQWLLAVGAVGVAVAAGIGGVALLRPPAAPSPVPTSAALPHFVPGDPANDNPFIDPKTHDLTEDDFRRALREQQKKLAETTFPDERRRRALNIVELGRAAHYRDKGAGYVALAAYEDALLVFREQNEYLLQVNTLFHMANAAIVAGQGDRAERSLRETEKILGQPSLSGPEFVHMRGQLLVSGTEICLDLGFYEQARRSLEQYAESERKRGVNRDSRYTAHYKRFKGQWALCVGRYDEAKCLLDEAAQEMLRLNDLQTRADILGNLGDLSFRTGNFRAAKPFYEDGLKVWAKTDQAHWTGIFKARLARLALAEGDEAAAHGDTRGRRRSIRNVIVCWTKARKYWGVPAA